MKAICELIFVVNMPGNRSSQRWEHTRLQVIFCTLYRNLSLQVLLLPRSERMPWRPGSLFGLFTFSATVPLSAFVVETICTYFPMQVASIRGDNQWCLGRFSSLIQIVHSATRTVHHIDILYTVFPSTKANTYCKKHQLRWFKWVFCWY